MEPRRVFVLGAGFSKPSGMPLAADLLKLLQVKLPHEEMRQWLDGLCTRLSWMGERDGQPRSLSIEEVFHYAHFDIEILRLKQQLVRVGRHDGETPWRNAESITLWLRHLEDALVDVILDAEDNADHAPVARWAESVRETDTVLTFNYDTLVETALSRAGKAWNHGTGQLSDRGIPVCKAHGSIDWIVAHRVENCSKCDLLFDKPNESRWEALTGHEEDECRLWRCRNREQQRKWIGGRDLQMVHADGAPSRVGMAGLGMYKPLHRIPGLGRVWLTGMQALVRGDSVIVIGFSMSDFDAMAQLQFAQVARDRHEQGRPLSVTVIDPCADNDMKRRFERILGCVEIVSDFHQNIDWSRY